METKESIYNFVDREHILTEHQRDVLSKGNIIKGKYGERNLNRDDAKFVMNSAHTARKSQNRVNCQELKARLERKKLLELQKLSK